MRFNRTANAKRTIVSGMIHKILSMIVPFLIRTLIIHTLGNLYLGLNSLFTSILKALNLAELGIGSALVFAMYKPVADDDKEHVRALLNVYRLSYYVIGSIVLVCGLILIPFLPRMIHGEYPAEVNIYIIYLLHLGATVSGYFFQGYRRSILDAYQRTDIFNRVSIVMDVLFYALQAVALLRFQNYYLYVGVAALRSIVFNQIIWLITRKKFSDIEPSGKISREERNLILRKIGALIGHKAGDIVVNSVDNILISAYIGLNVVAVYNNYFYVFTSLSGLFFMLINGLTSIVGNYLIQEDQSKIVRLFNILHFYIALMVCICCTCLLNMYQPFVSAWLGDESLLPFSSVILFTVYFFIVKIKTIVFLFKDAAGLWEKDAIKPYLQIVVDLIIDLILLRMIGINGAIISSIVCILIGFIYETAIVFKYCLKSSSRHFCINTGIYLGATMVSCTVAMILCRLCPVMNDFVTVLTNFLVSTVVAIFTFTIFTFRTTEFSYAVKYMRSKIGIR